MKHLVALAVSLAFIIGQAAGRTVGDSKCTWGPSYWCSGLHQSAKCGATSHCISKFWNNNPYPRDDDQVCTICKEMVKEARDQLESNETQTEIKEVFEGSCDLIPIKMIAKECKTLADEFIVQLVDTLASEMNPDTVCAVAGLCNSGRIDKMLEQYYSSRDVRTDCDVCNEQTEKLSPNIRLMPKDNVLDKALQMCGRLSSYSDACKIEVLDNFDDIYDALTHLNPLCDLTGICSETFSNVPTTLTSQGKDLECEFCEKVIQHWIDQWKANSTQEEFKEVLESICKKLGQPDRISRCLHIVDDYYIPFFNYILNDLNAHDACAAVGLCGQGDFFQLEPDLPVSIMLPHDVSPDVKDTLSVETNEQEAGLIGGYFMPMAAQEMIRPGCAICEFVLYRLREWLQDEHTQDEIEDGLNKICAEAPSSLKAQCDNLVQLYGPAIVQLIIQDANPKEICGILNICKEDLAIDIEVAAAVPESPITQYQKKNENCATCQYVMAIVMSGIHDKDNQDEIRNVLDSVCTVLPKSMSGKCENFVNAYAEEIMDMIADNLTAEQICEGLSFCERQRPKGGNTCDICEFVLVTLEHALEDKTNVDEIKEGLKAVCLLVPYDKYQKECKAFVEVHTDAIVDMIVHGMVPEEICKRLHVCPEESQDRMPVKESTKCSVCQFVVAAIDKSIEDPNDVEEVKEFLEEMCTYMYSDKLKQECKGFVDTYTAAILDMIAHGASPQEVCQELGMCDNRMVFVGEESGESSVEDSSEEDSSEEVDLVEVEDVQAKKPYCLLCEYAIGEVDQIIEDKHNEEEVRNALDTICYKLSKPLTKECLNFVNSNMDKLIHMFVNDYTPEKVCTALRLCEKAEKPAIIINDISRFDNYPVDIKPLKVQNNGVCTICEFGMRILEKEIFNNRTLDMAEHAILMMCSYIPGKYADKCEQFVEEYGEQIIDLIVESELSPDEICTELGLCDALDYFDATPVGGRRCNFGPAFWCQSRFHKMQCGTANFCASDFGKKFWANNSLN